MGVVTRIQAYQFVRLLLTENVGIGYLPTEALLFAYSPARGHLMLKVALQPIM